MPTLFIVSHIVLWVLMIFISIFVVTLYKRLNTSQMLPMNDGMLMASDHGIPEGEFFSKLSFPLVDGGTMDLQQTNKEGTILFLSSTQCKICEEVYAAIAPLMDKYPEYQFVTFMEGSHEEIDEKRETYDLDLPIFQLQQEDFELLQIDFFPFAYFLSPDGNVIGKGLINNGQDVNRLIEIGIEVNGASTVA